MATEYTQKPMVPQVMALPQLEEGLSAVDCETLRKYVAPIWNSLAAMNAEELLSLERVPEGFGAKLYDGVYVLPIHDQITPPKPQFRSEECVRYLHVAEVEERYSIGIFVFPPHSRIPLHDHPDMCVLSRVLYGDLTRNSLDLDPTPVRRQSWLANMFSSSRSNSGGNSRPRYNVPSNAKPAFRRDTDHLEAPGVTMLFPYEGNLHEFTAGPNGAAVLDVLLPPYDGVTRECTFYNVQDDQISDNPRSCWIIPTGQPEDYHCISGEYRQLGKDNSLEDD